MIIYRSCQLRRTETEEKCVQTESSSKSEDKHVQTESSWGIETKDISVQTMFDHERDYKERTMVAWDKVLHCQLVPYL